jgi:hypothetical protein
VAAVVGGSDSALQDLVDQLQGAGMDHLQIDAGQVLELAGADNTFDAGTHVTVVGTAFLGQGADMSAAGVASLFSAADVTVQLDSTDFGQVLDGGDQALDTLVSQLTGAGVDRIELDAGQASALVGADINGEEFSFAAGTDVTVDGANFLLGGETSDAEAEAEQVAAQTLFGAADLTVKLSNQDVAAVVGGSDSALQDLVDQLQGAGMDHLQIDAGQVLELAGADNTFDAGTHVTVVGTAFLGQGADMSAAGVASLFSAADVTVQLDSTDFGQVLDGGDQALDTLVSQLTGAGVDRIELDAGQAHQLVLPGDGKEFSFVEHTDVTVDGVNFIDLASSEDQGKSLAVFGAADLTVKLSAQDIHAIAAANLTAADGGQAVLQAMQLGLDSAGVDQLMITDDLANALTESDIEFLKTEATQVAITVEAKADIGGGTAYLHSSLQDMQTIGVDQVVLDAGVTHVEVALRDKSSNSLTLDDIAHFFQNNEGQTISLVLDTDDLTSLLTLDPSFETIENLGITGIRLEDAPGGLQSGLQSALDDALTASGLTYATTDLTPVESALLGLGADATDPFGFGIKHP